MSLMKNKIGDIWIELTDRNGYRVYVLAGIERTAFLLAHIGTLGEPTPESVKALGTTPAEEPKRYKRMNYAGIPHVTYIDSERRLHTIVPFELWHADKQKKQAGN